MERVRIADDLSYSRLNMGMLKLNEFKMTDKELVAYFEELIDTGITTLDFASNYGNGQSEKIFGRVLKLQPSLRDRVEINTKCGNYATTVGSVWFNRYYDLSYKSIIASAEESLRRFGVNTIDTLSLHRIDHMASLEEIARAFEDLHRSGKVRYFGASNHLPIHMDALRSFFPQIVSYQMRFSCHDVTNFENGCAHYAQQHKIALTGYGVLARGKVFNEQSAKTVRVLKALERIRAEMEAPSLSCVCYSFLLSHPAKIMPIVGSTKFSRVLEAVTALDYPMNRMQWYQIYEACVGDVMP